MVVVATKVRNNTKYLAIVGDGQNGVFEQLMAIRPGDCFHYRGTPDNLYPLLPVKFPHCDDEFKLPSDAFSEWEEILFRPKEGEQERFEWKGTIPRQSASHLVAWKGASKEIGTVARYSVELENLLNRVIICHQQCNHLVKFCSMHIQKIGAIFSLVSVDQIRSLYKSKKLPRLSASLDNLLRGLLSAQLLLEGCGRKEWRRAALVLSLPQFDPEKWSGSKFALLIRELGWSFDTVRYILGKDGSEDLPFEWRDGRYVLPGEVLENGAAIDEMESLQGDNMRNTSDRVHLLWYLDNTSFLSDNYLNPLAWRRLLYMIPHGKFAAAVRSRCLKRCFEIDYSDLKIENRISNGAYKIIHKGQWLGLQVAIATIWETPREVVEREAEFMVTVHHPNVVDFFGYAFKEEETKANQWTSYLVMELMEEDLGKLIERVTNDPLAVRRPDSGSPFSLSVTVDILIQIVEAMIHSHKHNVMHRDLKTNNCLVSKKFAPQSDVDVYYRVKLIDFGISKLWDSEKDIHTWRRGTPGYMAPEVWDGGAYTCSADVYSFGMVCYEVTTGSRPFNFDIRSDDYYKRVRVGERPDIPGTCPKSLNTLMTNCWAADPDARPTFEAIRKDLWDFKRLIEL